MMEIIVIICLLIVFTPLFLMSIKLRRVQERERLDRIRRIQEHWDKFKPDNDTRREK